MTHRLITGISAAAILAMGVAVATPAMAQSQQQPTPAPSASSSANTRVDSSIRRGPGNDFVRGYDLNLAFNEPEAAVESYKRGLAVSDCVTKSEDNDLTTMIDGEFAKAEDFDRLMTGMKKGNRFCVKSDQPAVPFFVNAAMSERFVQSLDRSDASVLPKAANMGAAQYFFMGGKDDVSIFTIGRCVSVLSPQLALGVLDTTVGSDEEAAALDRLYAETPMCGVKAAPTNIPTAFQRATISTALYEWHRVSKLVQ